MDMDDSPRSCAPAVNFCRIPTPDDSFFAICAGAIAHEVECQHRDVSNALRLAIDHVVTIDMHLARDRHLLCLNRIETVNPLVLHRVKIRDLGRVNLLVAAWIAFSPAVECPTVDRDDLTGNVLLRRRAA
jgi:hypothetical protein